MRSAFSAVGAAVIVTAGLAGGTAAQEMGALDGARRATAALEALRAAVDAHAVSGRLAVRAVAGGCDGAVRRAASAYGVPEVLALAMAQAESGRRPWAVNSALTGRSFASRDEAIRYVEAERRQGVVTIDVGCLQVNLYWHPEAFATLAEAFDPDRNAAAGLARLADLRRETGSWTQAVARYHGGAVEEQARYVCAVTEAYRRLMGRSGGACGMDLAPPPGAAAAPLASLGPDEATRERIARAQRHLVALGYTAGRPDGLIGPATARALNAFQKAHGLPPTGRLTAETAQALEAEVADRPRGVSEVVVANREAAAR